MKVKTNSKNALILVSICVKIYVPDFLGDVMLKFFKLIVTALTFMCSLCIVIGIPTSLFAHLFGPISQIYVRTVLLSILTAIPVFLVIFAKKESSIFNITYVCAAFMFIIGWFIPIPSDDYTKDDGWLIAFYPPIWLFFQFFYMPIALYFKRNFLTKVNKHPSIT